MQYGPNRMPMFMMRVRTLTTGDVSCVCVQNVRTGTYLSKNAWSTGAEMSNNGFPHPNTTGDDAADIIHFKIERDAEPVIFCFYPLGVLLLLLCSGSCGESHVCLELEVGAMDEAKDAGRTFGVDLWVRCRMGW